MTDNEVYRDHCNDKEAQYTARKTSTQEYEEIGDDICLKNLFKFNISNIVLFTLKNMSNVS